MAALIIQTGSKKFSENNIMIHTLRMTQHAFEKKSQLFESRMKRVIQLINKISEKIPEEYSSMKASFDMLNINYLEDDLIPSNDSNRKFQKIIDENLDGVSRHSKILSEECL